MQDRLENCDGRGTGVLRVPHTGADEAGGHEDEGVHTKQDLTTDIVVKQTGREGCLHTVEIQTEIQV